MAIKRYVGLGQQTVFAVPVPAEKYIRTKENIISDPGWYIPKPIIRRSYSVKQPVKYLVTGTVGEFDARPDNIGELIYMAQGIDGYVCHDYAPAYEHEFGISDRLPFYTFRIGVERKERVIPGLLCNKLTFRFGTSLDALKVIANIVGRGPENDVSLATLSEASFSAESMFSPMPSEFLVETTNRVAHLFDGEISIENVFPIDKMRSAGRYLTAIRYGERKVTGRLSLAFDDLEERDKFLNETSMKFTFTWFGYLITAGFQHRLKMILYDCHFLRDVSGHVAPIDEPLILNAPFQAFFDSAEGDDILVMLQNKETTYYKAP